MFSVPSYSRTDALGFIAMLSNEGLLKPPIMGTATPGDALLLRNGATLRIYSIRRDPSKSYISYKVAYVGLKSIELEYDEAGLSMDSEYADERPAPFDVLLIEPV